MLLVTYFLVVSAQSLGSLAVGTSSGTPGRTERDRSNKKKVAFLVNQARGRSAGSANTTPGRRALKSRSSKGDAAAAPVASGDAAAGGEPDHALLRDFFKGLINRTGGAPAGAKDKKTSKKTRQELASQIKK